MWFEAHFRMRHPETESGVPRAARDKGSFLYSSFFVAIPLFKIGVRSTRPDLSVLKVRGQSPVSGPEHRPIFSGRPGHPTHKVEVNFQKNLHPSKGPCGSRVYGSYFFEKPCFPIPPRGFEYGKVRAGTPHGIKKKSWQRKRTKTEK